MPKGTERRVERVTFRAPPTLIEALAREAETQRRSVSDTIVVLLEDALAKRTRKGGK